MDESLADQAICKSDETVHILYEKSGGLHLLEPGLMAGRLSDKIWIRLEILKACCRLKYSIFRFGSYCIVSATLMHF